MANLGQKNGVFHVRFRFQGKEYKKSLKTRNREDAEAAVHGVGIDELMFRWSKENWADRL